tara:strand:- start:222 stop:1661 length:1440 start_codon:yes stop_codon:yes gene_type:complete
MEVFRKNPILKENIYKQMRDMGLEPERYVVGSDFNSINPVTGQPEFFLKKIFKGVKNVFKGVKKVFKVVAPLLITAAVNTLFPGLGAIAVGAISGGITSLVQGGDLKDALKGAAIGGALGGVTKAVQGARGAASAGESVLTGAKEGFMAAPGVDPYLAGAGIDFEKLGAPEVTRAQIEKQAAEILTEPVVDSGTAVQGGAQSKYPYGFGTGENVTTRDIGAGTVKTDAGTGTVGSMPAGATVTDAGATVTDAAATAPIRATTPIDAVQRILGVDEFKGQRDILGGLKDLFLPGGTRTEAEIRRILADRGITEANNPALFKSELVRLARRGFVERALPLGIAALGVSSLTEEEPQDFNVAEAVENPLIGNRRYSPGTFLPRPTYTIATLGPDDFVVPSSSNVYQPVPGVAQGGGIDENIFPRMNGPIEGPGTETSDDIPAMLSDGEFVMTAKAVRGAGNGSRREGMRNMYQMMSNFEARA